MSSSPPRPLGGWGFRIQTITPPMASRTTRASGPENSVFHCVVPALVSFVSGVGVGAPGPEDNGISSTHIGISAV